jgi:hypothetical protein
MDSTTQNSERKDTHVSFHKAKISETFDKNPSSVDLNLTPVFSRFRVALYFFYLCIALKVFFHFFADIRLF